MPAEPPNGRPPKDAPPPGDFDARLKRAQAREQRDAPQAAQPGLLGLAFRLGVELVAGVVVGAFIGYFLDRWLGTSPWLLIVFFILGTAAGFTNVFRTARQMNAGAAASAANDTASAPPVRDDDED